MTTVYLALGANIGTWSRHTSLDIAITRLSHSGLRNLFESSRYETDPVGFLDQGKFINSAIRAETDLSPREILNVSLAIEKQLGRVRTIKNGPRTIDIDLLFFGDNIINEEDLIVPHPRLHERLFVLDPLVEIAPGFVHPVLCKTIKELHDTLR